MSFCANGKDAAAACLQAFFSHGAGHKDFGAVLVNHFLVYADGLSFGVASGVSAGNRHRGHGKFIFPLHFKALEAFVAYGLAQGGKVKVHQRKDSLRFRIAKADVVFQKLGPVLCYHDAKEDEAPIVKAFSHKAAQGGLQNRFVKGFHNVWSHVGQRANRSHAAGVGALGSVVQSFVVAGGQEGQNRGFAGLCAFRRHAYGCQNRHFDSGKVVFHQKFFCGVADAARIHQVVDRGHGFVHSLGHHNAFSGGKSVGL